jgi:Calcineurin-like phosphoesterase
MFRSKLLVALGPIACIGLISWTCRGSDERSSEAGQSPTPVNTTATRTVAPASQAPTPEPTPFPDPVLVGAGDITSCTQENDTVTAALIDDVIAGSAGEVVVFTAGDNVYEDGTAEEYEQCYDPTWGRHKDRTRPAPGNHEYHLPDADGYFGYFGAAAGQPGKGYYSYDLGAWHIIVLNTSDHCESLLCSAGSPQEQWLRADLAAHPAECTLTIWHDPLFSSGRVHGRHRYVQPFWDALYESGAEIVVNGHEHNYERFAPQTPAGEANADKGIRQFVVGTGGESHYREGDALIANSEAADDETYGVLKLTLHASGYDWEFLPEADGNFRDAGGGTCHTPP